MKRTQRGDHLARRADRRVLKESGARPAKSAFLDQGGDPGDDGFREGVPRHVRIGALTRLATLAALRRPQVAPDAVDPIQAPTPGIIVSPDGVPTTAPGGSSENKRREGEEVGPRAGISVRDDVGKGNDEAAGPVVARTSGDRRPNAGTAGEDVPDRRGSLSERTGVGRAVMGGFQDMKARRAPPVKPQAEDPLADLTRAKALTPEPVGWHLPEELTCHVRLKMRTDGVEGGPTMGGESMVGAGSDGAEETGGAGAERLIRNLGQRGLSGRAAATAVAGRRGGRTTGRGGPREKEGEQKRLGPAGGTGREGGTAA